MIRFGTEGWRAVISEEFTFENVRLVAQAIADYVLEQGGSERGVVVGYDTRFLSDRYAKECASVLAGNGIRSFLTMEAAPTPAVSFAVKNLGAAGGIMVTASHNPPEYNGIKFKADYGGSALSKTVAGIEEKLCKGAKSKVPYPEYQDAFKDGLISLFDPGEAYLNQIKSLVDLQAIRQLRGKIVIDPMYGAGRGYLSKVLEGLGLDVYEIHGELNPGFGGINPEPIEKNLEALRHTVARRKVSVGLATDGDADRIGAIDEMGEFVDPHRIYALLLQHLVECRGWRGGVVKTFSTTQMVEELADSYHLPIFETPIGFKYICELFLTEDILIGGEESGGIGIKNHIPERDGILIGLLLLEAMALRGQSLSEMVKCLLQTVGPYFYGRIDQQVKGSASQLVDAIKRDPPDSIAGFTVFEIRDMDGVKFFFKGKRWLLLRGSGTEPVVRIYAEAQSRQEVKHLLSGGLNLLANERDRIFPNADIHD